MLKIQTEANTQTVSISELLRLAAQGLPQMIVPGSGIFCHLMKMSRSGLVSEGLSPRYTMMTLLGLHRYELRGGSHTIDKNGMLSRLLGDLGWIDGAGDLGLLLWTCAVIAPDRLDSVVERVNPQGALDRYIDGQKQSTMEVAWMLTGAAHCALAGFAHAGVEAEGEKALAILKKNCGASGLFGHLAFGAGIIGRLRGRIGTFADQVYPIIALSMHAKAKGDKESLEMAIRCASQICRLQGAQGEWWWHYDSLTGTVTSGYPVYSVHQHAMGPMALLALREVTGEDYIPQIRLGLDWIAGKNDLHADMRNSQFNLVWRNFYQNRPLRYANEVLQIAGIKGSNGGLHVNYECRPYELGWLLYAMSELM